MRIEINKKKFFKIGDKKSSDQLMEYIKDEGKKVKLQVPFLADGFKSTKNPTQPDGVTPIVVEKAGLINETLIISKKPIEEKVEIKEEKVEKKVLKKKK